MDVVPILVNPYTPHAKLSTLVQHHLTASRRIECPADVGVLRPHASSGSQSIALHVTMCDRL
jgi:hypothetical protein